MAFSVKYNYHNKKCIHFYTFQKGESKSVYIHMEWAIKYPMGDCPGGLLIPIASFTLQCGGV